MLVYIVCCFIVQVILSTFTLHVIGVPVFELSKISATLSYFADLRIILLMAGSLFLTLFFTQSLDSLKMAFSLALDKMSDTGNHRIKCLMSLKTTIVSVIVLGVFFSLISLVVVLNGLNDLNGIDIVTSLRMQLTKCVLPILYAINVVILVLPIYYALKNNSPLTLNCFSRISRTKKIFSIEGEITKKINKLAAETMAESAESFDQKRKIFQSKLKEFYDSESLSSEDLIVRRNEINFLGQRLTDVLFSAAVGTVMGLLINFEAEVFQTVIVAKDALTKILNITLFAVLFGFLWLFLIWLTKFCARLNNYQKFSLEKDEIKLIDKVLKKRQAELNQKQK